MAGSTARLGLPLALLLCCATAPAQARICYEFTQVVDLKASGVSLFDLGQLDMNNAGQVAFALTQGVFEGPAPLLTRAGVPVPYAAVGNDVTRNTLGILFSASVAGSSRLGLFSGADPVLDTVVDSDDGYSQFLTPFHRNELGQVAFHAGVPGEELGVFTGPNPATDRLATVSDTLGPYFSLNDVRIDGAGNVYLLATTAPGGLPAPPLGIFTGPDPVADAFVVEAVDGGGLDVAGFRAIGAMDVNDAGDIAFTATFDRDLGVPGQGSGVFFGPDLDADAFVTSENSDILGFGEPALNENGEAAFVGTVSQGNALYRGPDSFQDAIILPGEPLFGSQIDLIITLDIAYNDAQQVAFGYFLRDGGYGIARGAPDGTSDDRDCDGIPDSEDACPDRPSPPDFVDTDCDGIRDSNDNCSEVPNGLGIAVGNPNVQADQDGDLYGDLCDADFNQDLFVGGPDFDIFLQCFNKQIGAGAGNPPEDPFCAESDLNNDFFVGGPDFDIFLGLFGRPPGPSGRVGSLNGGCGLGFELVPVLGLLLALRRRR